MKWHYSFYAWVTIFSLVIVLSLGNLNRTWTQSFTSSAAIAAAPSTTQNSNHRFHLNGNKILTAAGQPFIPVGFNSVQIWLDKAASRRGLQTEIAKSGANAVRLVTAGEAWTWNHQSDTPQKKQELVEIARSAGLLPILEAHDGTCVTQYDRSPGQGKMGLKQIVDHWLLPENVALFHQYPDDVWLNIANEWGPADDPAWASGYKRAIRRLRQAGIENILVIDAGGCGQDPNTLLKWGSAVAASDPLNRVILSIHLYTQWTTQDGRPAQYSVETYLPQLKALSVPVILGEFGWSGESVPYNPRTLVATVNAMDMGWLFWAWYCNAHEPQFNASTAPDTFDLTEAGQFLVNDAENGLKALAQTRNL